MSAETLRACACGCGHPAPIAARDDVSRGHVVGQQIRFIKGHNAKFWTMRPAEERFWEKVEKTDTCWLWIAGLTRQGYGRFAATSDRGAAAHRYSYELAKGTIPAGLVIDHLCRVKRCVNPEHLDAVTTVENVRRSHPAVLTNRCKRDHEFDEQNTGYRKDGSRRCRACQRIRQEASRVQ